MSSKKKKQQSFGIISTMIFISVIIMLLSLIMNKLGVKGYTTEVGTLETSIETVNNIFSRTGLRYIFSTSVINFRLLEPLVVLIMSLISISILDASGLLRHIFTPLKNVKPSVITFSLLFIGIISTFLGDYSYAILLPLVGVLYKYIGRDPKLGIFTIFIGITMGCGTGLLYNYQDIILGNLTQIAAQDITPNYLFHQNSLMFILIASTLLISFIGTGLIEKYLAKKYRKSEVEELTTSKTALRTTGIVFIVILALLAYCITPGLPLSGLFLDTNADNYLTQLLGENAPFHDGFVLIIVLTFMVCGYIYGKISRNIKNNKEYNQAISKTFENTGMLFATMFFASIMLSIFEWTNIGTVTSLKLLEFMSTVQLSGIFLIALTFIVIVIITIMIPSTVVKWTMASPILVPLLMRANITPAFSQMIFKAADSVGKCFTPFYIYLIVAIGFLYKYNSTDEDITLFGTIKKMLPILIILSITWLIIILGWNVLGFKIGVGTYTTI